MTRPEEFEWVKDKAPVWYQPSLSSNECFAGRVSGDPWPIGGSDETWVVRLDEVDPGYRNGRGTVKAAYLGALTPREETERRRPPVSFERSGRRFWLHTLDNTPTQEETTDVDLVLALQAMPTERIAEILQQVDPDLTAVANRAVSVVVRRLNQILDSGEHQGTYGDPALEELVQRLLALRAYPNITWETLVRQLDSILDTGAHHEAFQSDNLNRFARRLVEIRKDTKSLEGLRGLLDKYLFWPAPAAQEQRRYDLGIEHTGRLAQLARNLQHWINQQRESGALP